MDTNPSLTTGNNAMSEKLGDLSPHAPNRLIVKLKDGLSRGERRTVQTIKGNLSVANVKTVGLTGAEIWELPTNVSVEKALAQYRNSAVFEYIEPDYIVTAGAVTPTATLPNDPGFNQLWGLNNTGQSGGTVDADIDAPEAWDIQTGDPNLVIGVIDSGVDYNHPDLVGNIWTNTGEIAGDGIDNDGNGYVDDIRGWDFAYNDNDPMDVDGHGTHVSGTIAGKGNNGVGVTGVAWNAKIMPLKFLDDSGSGSTSDAILAIDYATAQGVKITNNSWGGGGFSQALYDAINTAGQQGALFIAAAGNDTNNNDANPSYPASYNLANIVSVASTTRTDALSWFSNYGLTSVDLGAPGSDIYSLAPNGGYATLSGTSMASPHVAGAAALLWSENPDWTAQQVKNALMNTGDSIAALAGKTVSGKRLNVYNALAAANLPSVTVSVSPASVQEDGATNLVYTFTRTNLNLSSPLTVNFAVSGTANAALVGTDPADYTVLTSSAVTFNPTTKLGAVTFAANATTATVTVDPIADTLAEIQNETVTVAINSGTGYIGGSSSAATGTIVSEEMLPVFSNPNLITIPDSGSGTPYPSTINVSGLSGNINSLKVTLTNLNHTYPDDIDVLLVGPTGAKTLLMSDVGGFNALTNVTLTFDAIATSSLPDSDPIASGSYQPTNIGDGDIFNSPAPSGPYGADFSVFNNTSPNGIWSLYVMDDFGGDSGTITGGWSLTIGTETLPVVTVVATDASAAETLVGATPNPGVYTLTRTGSLTSALTVNVAMSGTATNGSDYTAIPTTVTFGANSATAVVNLSVIDDALVESAETAILTIGAGTGYTVGATPSATVNIASDDTAVEAVGNTKLLKDGGNKYYAQAGSNTPISIKNGTTHVYEGIYSGWQTLAAETVSGVNQVLWVSPGTNTMHVWVMDSGWTRTSTQIIGSLTSSAALAQETVFGVDANGDGVIGSPTTVTLAVSPASVTEDGAGNLVYTFTRGGATTNALTVNYSIAGTADGSDYTGATPGTGKTITFAAGAATATLTLDPTADAVVESNESVALTLVTGTGYTIGTTAAVTGTITNDDTAVEAVGNTKLLKDGGNKYFAQAGSNTPISIKNGTTHVYEGIYSGWQTLAAETVSGVNQMLWVSPGTNTMHVWVMDSGWTRTSTQNIGSLTSSAALAQETVFGVDANGDGVIGSPPTAVTLAVSPASVMEDGAANLVYTFTRGGATTNALTVNYSIAGTADAADYTGATPGTGKTITFAAGAATATLTIDPTADGVVEADETVALTLATGTGYTVGTVGAVTGTITNDDGLGITLIGDDDDDYLLGGTGNDTLQGLGGNDILNGGPGADILEGGEGSDTYYVDNSGDVVTDVADSDPGEIDTVFTSITYTLPNTIENLVMLNTGNVNDNINATGNSFSNKLTGNSGNNVLTGLAGNDALRGKGGNDALNGGAGRDTLTGGTGLDTLIFQFGQSLVAGPDRITDFAVGADKIDLLTQAGAATAAPTAFSRAVDSSLTTLTNVVNAVFTDADGATAGNQALGVNSAALVTVTTAGIVGTYLVINDGTAGFQSANDSVVNITGFSGALPALGTIPVANFFV